MPRDPYTDLSWDFSRALDPVVLSRDCGFEPDPWQADMLRCDAKDILLLSTRQGGKSTSTSIKALHVALYPPRITVPATVLLISPSQRQSGELFDKVYGCWRKIDPAYQSETDNQTEVMLRNGSRIVSLPGVAKTIRGYSAADLVVYDEASEIDDDVFVAAGPALANTNGTQIALSTPKGRRGKFFHWWQRGGDRWARFRVTADECPRITPEFLERMRTDMSPQAFRQEFYCEFYDAESAAFSGETVDRAMRRDFDVFL
ncbi:terminase large subunit domain-containing protein [Nitrospirillum iridis]|uniref:Terminase n=1 Tax=Nitrospirillum iridis TaxID=765888 RepID=A0A7X0EGG7_9PROT|nr:terminase family protein [Nitrospirillum iridis]MBB6254101.1 hypothetical protein [Nitrospirillum iridis]